MAKQHNTHGSPELDVDATKLAAMGADPGPTQDDIGLVPARQEVSTAGPQMGTAVAEPLDTLALLDEASGKGFEEVKATDLALPQFKLLQSTSPQVKRSEAAYIPGAEEGIWHDVISNRLFREITIVPCKFATYYIEWDGAVRGRLINNHGTDSRVMERTRRDDKTGQNVTKDGTIIVPTATWFGVVIAGIEKTPAGDDHIRSMARCIVSMAGTAQKISRRWISDAQSIQLQRKNGSFFTPPLFAMSYALSAQATKNDRGSWFLPVVRRAGFTLDLPHGLEIFKAAQEFGKFASESTATTIIMNADDAPGAEESGQRSQDTTDYQRQPVDDEIPF